MTKKEHKNRGGIRHGAGRPKTLPDGAKVRPIKVTDEEYEQVKLLIQKLRS